MSTSIQVTRTVSASPEELFALLSNPARHADLDGSSMIRGVESSDGPVSAVGDQFVMKMHNDKLGDYQMRNTITAFEPHSTIGWSPALESPEDHADKLGDMKVGGHTYTWVLEPAGGGGTKVTQTYDWSDVTDEKFKGMLPMLDEKMLSDSIERAGKIVG